MQSVSICQPFLSTNQSKLVENICYLIFLVLSIHSACHQMSSIFTLLAILDNNYKTNWRKWYIWTKNFSWGGENFLLSDNKLIKFVKVLKSKWGSKTQMVPLNKNEIDHKVRYNPFQEISKWVSSSHTDYPPYWKKNQKFRFSQSIRKCTTIPKM